MSPNAQPHMDRIKNAAYRIFALVLLSLAVAPVAAQEPTLPSANIGAQSLRPYWHVFIAYAIAIVMVLGWVISIGRRLKAVEEKLGE
jgi:hypothetical protein